MLQKWSNKVYQAVYNITREGGFTVYRLEPGSLVLVPDPSRILDSEIGSNQLKEILPNVKTQPKSTVT